MKIAVISMYSGVINRGVETWTREYVRHLGKNHETLVVSGGLIEFDNSKSVCVSIKLNERLLGSLIKTAYTTCLATVFTMRSLQHLIRFQPDIVQPNNGGVQALIIRLTSIAFGWKVVFTGHAGIGWPDKWNLLMRPHAFVFPSKRALKWAKDLIFTKGIKMVHIPHAIILNKFDNVQGLKLDMVRPIILCVSSQDKYKRLELTLNAISKLEHASLLLIGEQSRTFDKKALSMLGHDRYKHLESSYADIGKYYKCADVFTLVSDDNEAFGIVYLEAMSANLPVVATDDELRKEIVGDAGILIDPKDPRVYANALSKALVNNWGSKPRNQASKFNWHKVIRDYENLFVDLLR